MIRISLLLSNTATQSESQASGQQTKRQNRFEEEAV